MASAKGKAVGDGAGERDEGFCKICELSFKGARGLGLHMKRKHPEDHNDRINVERVKKRWSPEETRLLADAESNLLISRPTSGHK